MRDVAFSCDDNGAKFLRVTVWSLMKHYRGAEPLRINIFEGFGGHSAESKSKLEALIREENEKRRHHCFSVRYHNVDEVIRPYADLILNREKSRWNVFTWTPIFTPLLLADATGNVAHFDIDMLFNDDVSKLLDLDLGDNLIAAVAEYGKGDPVITEAVWGEGILPPEAERYFNTGTIVFNVEKCRQERTWEKILAWYRDHYDIADRIEQDAWNALYWKRTRLLSLRWNFHDRLVKWFSKWDLRAKYWQGNPPGECVLAALKPAILHFWGPKKPWRPCHRPYRKLYHEAMRAVGQTPPREPLLAVVHDLLTWRRLAGLKRKAAGVRGVNFRNLRRRLLVPAEWLGIGVALCIIPWLPRCALYAFCDALAAVMYCFDRRGKRRALENLRIIRGTCTGLEGTFEFDPDKADYAPTRAERLVIRRSYRNSARSVGYAFWACVRAKARCAATGELDAATKAFLAGNRLAVTVSGHLGCWEILSQLAVLQGHRMISVAKDIGTGGMTALLIKARRSIGQEIVSAKGAFKQLMLGLHDGKSLGLLVDQSVSRKKGGIWITFFGRPMSVSPAPAFFAAKAKVPVVVAWSRPLRDGRYRCEFLAAHTPEEARDIRGLTQKIADELGAVIRRHPSCWILNYNYYSNRPEPKGAPEKMV